MDNGQWKMDNGAVVVSLCRGGDTLPRGEGDPQGRERNGEMVDALGSMSNGICARIPHPSAALTPSPRGKGWGADVVGTWRAPNGRPVAVPGSTGAQRSVLGARRPRPLAQVAVSATGGAPFAPPTPSNDTQNNCPLSIINCQFPLEVNEWITN